MSKTVVGLFATYAQAQQVKQQLVAQGYESQNITVVANDDEEVSDSSIGNSSASSSMGSSATAAGRTTQTSGAAGVGEKIGSFFRNLSGGDSTTHEHYATGVNQGGALLAVTVNDPQAEEVASLLMQHGAREIEGEYAGASASASTTSMPRATGATTTGVSGETMIPIVEEELVVGKRAVERGGVRIYSHVVERPVEAGVVLRDEQVHVERHAVNRPATAADFGTGAGETIELRAMGEEAVVGKTSRVVEEVRLGKESTEHTEAIHDTVRKTEVDVEQLDGTTQEGVTPRKAGY